MWYTHKKGGKQIEGIKKERCYFTLNSCGCKERIHYALKANLSKKALLTG